MAEEISSNERRQLLLRLARRPEGVTVAEAHREALEAGDNATQEAYHNLARRLAHRGLVRVDSTHAVRRFHAAADPESQWLEEEELAELVDPDFPLLSLPIWREAWRQATALPTSVWEELRLRLLKEPARDLFRRAIGSFADDFDAQVADLVRLENQGVPPSSGSRAAAENARQVLYRLAKLGMGLSREAIDVPASVAVAMSRVRAGAVAVPLHSDLLEAEIARRVEDAPFLVEVKSTITSSGTRPLLVAGIDGSSRSGMLALEGEEGDLGIGLAPMIAINTAVGVVNREMRSEQRKRVPVLQRLPERPEDLQRADNRYAFMTKLFFPDLSDSQYAHAVWNAMDLLESRLALRMLATWDGPGGTEVPPADVLLRDGAVSPQDRDFAHYAEQTSYGRIVRDLIRVHGELTLRVREGDHAVAGVVKNAQLSVYGPVLNWYAAQLAGDPTSQIATWPLQSTVSMPDQPLLTRLLTAGRGRGDEWIRTCFALRPFHATTNFADSYSRLQTPRAKILDRFERTVRDPDPLDGSNRAFWEQFRPESDPFLRLLDQAHYASCFVAFVPRLDTNQVLPRLELLVAQDSDEDAPTHWEVVGDHLERVFRSFGDSGGFDVAAEHSMFTSPPRIDVLPRILVRVHDTVKVWAQELTARVQDYLGTLLADVIKDTRQRGKVRLRPFSRGELQLLLQQLRQSREITTLGARDESRRLGS
jgi:hypothetical protein